MPRKPQPWFRFYVETPRDVKIRRLAPVHRWVWTCVLCVARESPIPGFLLISERLALTTADLADLAAVKEPEVRKALAAMEHLGLVAQDENLHCLFVPKFNARQYESDSSTERSRKHRSKNIDATLQQRSSNAPETETETELTKGGGVRPVPTRPVDATTAPPKCSKHPQGDTGESCVGCARVREWDEQQDERQRKAVATARRDCTLCDENGWQLDPATSAPVRRCNHRANARPA